MAQTAQKDATQTAEAALQRLRPRLRKWLLQNIGGPNLMRTSQAMDKNTYTLPPSTIPPSGTLPPDTRPKGTSTMLEALAPILRDDEISFAPALRHQTNTPSALSAVRQFDGIEPIWPAVITPQSPAHLAIITRKLAGQNIRLSDAGTTQTPENTLPVNFSQMHDLEMTCPADGLVRLERGADWAQLKALADLHDLAMPTALHDLFPTPFEAAQAGLFEISETIRTEDMTAGITITLPPKGTKWLDTTWLFRNETKAKQAMRRIMRQKGAITAVLTNDAILKVGHTSGAWSLPITPLRDNRFTALRLIFSGSWATVHSARFAASWTVEGLGGSRWVNGPVWPTSSLHWPVLAAGANWVTADQAINWGSFDREIFTASQTLSAAAIDIAQSEILTPITTRQIICTGSTMTMTTGVIIPRDFADAAAQWCHIHHALIPEIEAPSQGSSQAPRSAAQTAESGEWRAIRNALIDENGQVRPVPLLDPDSAPGSHNDRASPALLRKNG